MRLTFAAGQAPDLIEPFVGYRAWRYAIGDAGTHLSSVLVPAGDVWDGAWRDWVTAYCHPRVGDLRRHPAPDADCSCGFYAIRCVDDGDVLADVVRAQASGDSTDRAGMVIGRVQLAGKVIEHSLGYRAERARITALIPTTTDGGITRTVATRLGVPLSRAIETSSMFERFVTHEAAKRDALERAGERMLRRILEKIDGGAMRDVSPELVDAFARRRAGARRTTGSPGA